MSTNQSLESVEGRPLKRRNRNIISYFGNVVIGDASSRGATSVITDAPKLFKKDKCLGKIEMS